MAEPKAPAVPAWSTNVAVPLSKVLIETALILIPDATPEVAVVKLVVLARKLGAPVDADWLVDWCRDLCDQVWRMTA
jgi:hypothetical protein